MAKKKPRKRAGNPKPLKVLPGEGRGFVPKPPPGVPADPGDMPICIKTARGGLTVKRLRNVTVLQMREALRRRIRGEMELPPNAVTVMLKKNDALEREHGRGALVELHVVNGMGEFRIHVPQGERMPERSRIAGEPPDRPLDWIHATVPTSVARGITPPPPASPVSSEPEGVIVDYARKRLDAATDEIHALLRRHSESRWKSGAYYHRCLEQRLFESGGFVDAFAWAEENLPKNPPFEIEWNAALVHHFTEREAVERGSDFLIHVIRNAQLLGESLNGSLPSEISIVDAAGQRTVRDLNEVNIEDLDQSIQRAIKARLSQLGRALPEAFYEGEIFDDELPGELAFPQYPLPAEVSSYQRRVRAALAEALGDAEASQFAVFWRGGCLYERRDFSEAAKQRATQIIEGIPTRSVAAAIPPSLR